MKIDKEKQKQFDDLFDTLLPDEQTQKLMLVLFESRGKKGATEKETKEFIDRILQIKFWYTAIELALNDRALLDWQNGELAIQKKEKKQ